MILLSSEAFFPYQAYLQFTFRVSCRPIETNKLKSVLSLEIQDNAANIHKYCDVIAVAYQRKHALLLGTAQSHKSAKSIIQLKPVYLETPHI